MTKFRELEVTQPSELKSYFDLFVTDWKEYSYDALNTDIESFSRLEKVSKAKALKNILVELEEDFYNLIDKFENFDDPFPIYRAITVDNIDGFIKEIKGEGRVSFKGVGIFWSWDKAKAEAHWGETAQQTIIIKSLIKKKDVDWAKTIIKNLHLHLGRDEAEIQIYKKRAIEIIYIEKEDGTKIPLNIKTISYINNLIITLKSGTYKLLNILNPEKDKIQEKYFLDDSETAVQWAKENTSDLPDRFYKIDWNELSYRDRYQDQILTELYDKIDDYVTKYLEVKEKKKVKIYRAVCVFDINAINFNKLGVFWSFDREEARCINEHLVEEGASKYLLKGITDVESINWEDGFEMFVLFPEEMECRLLEGKPIKIIKINNKQLEEPIEAIS